MNFKNGFFTVTSEQQQSHTILMTPIDLNCDMGEGVNTDAQLMPLISSASIACGYHAGDADTMKKTVELALMHHVAIGAHPGFADKEFFGRRELKLSTDEVYDLIAGQISALKKITDSFQAKLHHVKPHGALYNIAARDASLARTIALAVQDVDKNLMLYGLSGSYLISEGEAIRLKTASEVFADRTYGDDGSLTPRSQPNALIEDELQCAAQVLQMITQQTVTSINGHTVPIVAQTICIHGDGKHAVAFAHTIYQSLKENRIDIKAP
ncbi:MAG TPA: 5-oxoprolinase subunit PxpA [Chitinophagales bacterium]|nr:5-oxoprolinase subunit PxpA [Chitinophagales bacterium]